MDGNVFFENSNQNIRPVSNTVFKDENKKQPIIDSFNRNTNNSFERERMTSSVFMDYDFRTKTRSLSPSMNRKKINSTLDNNEVIGIIDKTIKEQKNSFTVNLNRNQNSQPIIPKRENSYPTKDERYSQSIYLNETNANPPKINYIENSNQPKLLNERYSQPNQNLIGNKIQNNNNNSYNSIKSNNLGNISKKKENEEKYIKMSKSVDNISISSAIVDNVKAEIIILNSFNTLENLKNIPNDPKLYTKLENHLSEIRKLFFELKNEKLKMKEIMDLQKERLISLTFDPIVPSYIQNPELLRDLHSDVITLMEAYDKLYLKYQNLKSGQSMHSMTPTLTPENLQLNLKFIKNNNDTQESLQNQEIFLNKNDLNTFQNSKQNVNQKKFQSLQNTMMKNSQNREAEIKEKIFSNTQAFLTNPAPNRDNYIKNNLFKKPNQTNKLNMEENDFNNTEGFITNIEYENNLNLKFLKNQNQPKTQNVISNLDKRFTFFTPQDEQVANDNIIDNNYNKNNTFIKMNTENPSDMRINEVLLENDQLKNQIEKLKNNNLSIMNKLNSVFEKNTEKKISEKKYEMMKTELINMKKMKERYLNDNLKLNSEYQEILDNFEVSQQNFNELKKSYNILVQKIHQKNNSILDQKRDDSKQEKETKEVKDNYEIEMEAVVMELPEFITGRNNTVKTDKVARRISSERDADIHSTNLFEMINYKNKYENLLGEYNNLKNQTKNEPELNKSKTEEYYQTMVQTLQNEKKILYEKVLKCQKKNKVLLEKVKGTIEDKSEFLLGMIEVFEDQENILTKSNYEIEEPGEHHKAKSESHLIYMEKEILNQKKNEILASAVDPDKVREVFEFFEKQQENIKDLDKKLKNQKDIFNREIRQFSFGIKNDAYLFKNEKNQKIEKFQENLKKIYSEKELEKFEAEELIKEKESEVLDSDFNLDTPINSQVDLAMYNNSNVYNEKNLEKNRNSKFFKETQNSRGSLPKQESIQVLSQNDLPIPKSQQALQRINTEIINTKNKELEDLIFTINNELKKNELPGNLNQKLFDVFIEKLEILRVENKETLQQIRNMQKDMFELEKKNNELFKSNYLLTVILENRNTVVNTAETQNLILIDFIKKLKNKKLPKDLFLKFFEDNIEKPALYLKEAKENYLKAFENVKQIYQL